MELDKQIESILFFKGEAVSLKQLSSILERSIDEVKGSVEILRSDLQNRGIRLISNGEKVMLGTSPEMHQVIEAIKKEELSKDLGKASLETLSIILYKGPVMKSEIDYIRGVNSASILRNLLVRGLIEKKSESGKRYFLYYPTFELISFMGISKLEELPEYKKVRQEMEINSEEEEKEEDVENIEN